MTLIRPIDVKCPMCGNEFEEYGIMSSNTMGAPDLDLRPAPMYRDTISRWINQCPRCGYVCESFPTMSEYESGEYERPQITEEFLKSESYQSCNGIVFKSGTSKKFYRQYLIALELDDIDNEITALRHCAWTCDDAGDEANAVMMRKECVRLINQTDTNENGEVIKADLMRRAGLFGELIEEYSDKTYSEDILNDIIAFQIEKSMQEDTSCYTLDDIH